MSNTQSVLAQIEELVQSQTFTAAALEGIQAIKRQLAETLIERDKAQERNLELVAANQNMVTALDKRAEEIKDLRAEVKSLREQQAKAAEAIFDAQRHAAVAQAWKEAMQTVFKPNAVREAVQRNHTVVIPSSSGSAYTQSVQNQDFITREDA